MLIAPERRLVQRGRPEQSVNVVALLPLAGEEGAQNARDEGLGKKCEKTLIRPFGPPSPASGRRVFVDPVALAPPSLDKPDGCLVGRCAGATPPRRRQVKAIAKQSSAGQEAASPLRYDPFGVTASRRRGKLLTMILW